ncbi:hypothetical protein ACIKTA_16045 [Hansschlegelia beijingensis]
MHASGIEYPFRIGALEAALGHRGATNRLDRQTSRALWREIAEAAPLLGPEDRLIWRISVAPSRAAELVAKLRPIIASHFYDWSGGLVWIAVEPSEDACAAVLRPAVQANLLEARLIGASSKAHHRKSASDPKFSAD